MVSGEPKIGFKCPSSCQLPSPFPGASQTQLNPQPTSRTASKVKTPSEGPALPTASSAAVRFEICGAKATLSVPEFATGDCKDVPQGLKSPRENQDLRVQSRPSGTEFGNGVSPTLFSPC
jgi:hypothetical protein